jgi:PPM family protein phosphatase
MSGSSVRLQAVAASDRGRVRSTNQDACLVLPEQGLFILADGMGGHQAGEVAAQAVVSLLPRTIRKKAQAAASLRPRIAELILQEGIVQLSEQLRVQGAGKPGLDGMGATVALVWIPNAGETAYLAHIGDSRIYLWRDGRLQQLTEDHSLVGLLLKYGEVSAEEAARHPARGQLSRYIGMEGEAVPDVQTLALQDKDCLMLCSDGLTGMVPDDQIAAVLTEAPDMGTACHELMEGANSAGGKDNISIIIVDVQIVEGNLTSGSL